MSPIGKAVITAVLCAVFTAGSCLTGVFASEIKNYKIYEIPESQDTKEARETSEIKAFAELKENQSGYYVYGKPLDGKKGVTSVRGELPQFRNLPDEDQCASLNEKINRVYIAALDSLSSDIRYIEFGYKTTSGNGFMTVVLQYSKYSGLLERTVDTFTLRFEDFKEVNISDVLGPNAVKIINKLITQDAKRNPSKYNSSIAPITDEHDFYIEDGVFSVIFDEYELTPKRAELFELTLALTDYINLYISKDEYFSATSNKIKMIQAKQVADAFDYSLVWNAQKQTTKFIRDEKEAASAAIGINAYSGRDFKSKKLETFPQLRDGRTYLPITFYEEFLNLVYTVDSEGRICFSEYIDRK